MLLDTVKCYVAKILSIYIFLSFSLQKCCVEEDIKINLVSFFLNAVFPLCPSKSLACLFCFFRMAVICKIINFILI